MFPIACYQATGQYFAHSALNDRFPAILNAQNPAIPSAHPQPYRNLYFYPRFMIAQQSLECGDPAPLWIQDKIRAAGRNTKNGEENQSGAGVPQSKVRPERLTGKVPVPPVKFINIEQS